MSGELPSLVDLVSQPNAARLDEYAELYCRAGTSVGKFIRLGDLVLMAPLTDYGSIPNSSGSSLHHVDLVQAALVSEDEELRARVESARRPISGDLTLYSNPDGVTDAGFYNYSPTTRKLYLHDKSQVYGCADEEGRRLTAAIAKAALGGQVEVQTRFGL